MKIECYTINGILNGKITGFEKYPGTISFTLSRNERRISILAGKAGKTYWIVFPEKYFLNCSNIKRLLDSESDGMLIAEAYRILGKHIN